MYPAPPSRGYFRRTQMDRTPASGAASPTEPAPTYDDPSLILALEDETLYHVTFVPSGSFGYRLWQYFTFFFLYVFFFSIATLPVAVPLLFSHAVAFWVASVWGLFILCFYFIVPITPGFRRRALARGVEADSEYTFNNYKFRVLKEEHGSTRFQDAALASALALCLLVVASYEAGFLFDSFVVSDHSLRNWSLYALDNVLKVALLDTTETFGLHFSSIVAVGAWAKASTYALNLCVTYGLIKAIVGVWGVTKAQEFVGTKLEILARASAISKDSTVVVDGEQTDLHPPLRVRAYDLNRSVGTYQADTGSRGHRGDG